MAQSTNFHSLPFNTARTKSSYWKMRSDRQTEGQKISIFNIIDWTIKLFYNWKRKKQYLLGEKKLNIINW